MIESFEIGLKKKNKSLAKTTKDFRTIQTKLCPTKWTIERKCIIGEDSFTFFTIGMTWSKRKRLTLFLERTHIDDDDPEESIEWNLDEEKDHINHTIDLDIRDDQWHSLENRRENDQSKQNQLTWCLTIFSFHPCFRRGCLISHCNRIIFQYLWKMSLNGILCTELSLKNRSGLLISHCMRKIHWSIKQKKRIYVFICHSVLLSINILSWMIERWMSWSSLWQVSIFVLTNWRRQLMSSICTMSCAWILLMIMIGSFMFDIDPSTKISEAEIRTFVFEQTNRMN